MKAHLTKASLALLSAVFILGCQDLGTGAVELDDGPQFDMPGQTGELCPGSEALRRDGKGHCHEEEPPPPGDDATYTVTITGPATDPAVLATTQEVTGPGLLAQDILVDLSGFPICNLGVQEGQLFMPVGEDGEDEDHVHFSFRFMHTETGGGVESKHWLTMLGEFVGGGFPPTTDTPVVIIIQKADEPWAITSKGKNHQNGCKGEGDTVDFTVTFALR